MKPCSVCCARFARYSAAFARERQPEFVSEHLDNVESPVIEPLALAAASVPERFLPAPATMFSGLSSLAAALQGNDEVSCYLWLPLARFDLISRLLSSPHFLMWRLSRRRSMMRSRRAGERVF